MTGKCVDMYPVRIAVSRHPKGEFSCIEIIVSDMIGEYKGIVHLPVGSWFYRKLADVMVEVKEEAKQG